MLPARTLFIDRDGVVNVNRPDHVKAWEEFEFLADLLAAARQILGADTQPSQSGATIPVLV